MGYKNPEKQKEYQKIWYQKNKESHRQSLQTRRNKRKRWMIEYKIRHPCVRCGQSQWQCLDFHHKNPEEKIYGIAEMANMCCNIDKLKEEIKKCIILCANCHRLEHYVGEVHTDE